MPIADTFADLIAARHEISRLKAVVAREHAQLEFEQARFNWLFRNRTTLFVAETADALRELIDEQLDDLEDDE